MPLLSEPQVIIARGQTLGLEFGRLKKWMGAEVLGPIASLRSLADGRGYSPTAAW
jgi:hypothetical protein